jgi:hypothetical protein
LGADRFAAASLERVDNPVLARLPLVGALDQVLDCRDVLSHPALTSPMRCYYDAMAAENPRQTRNGGQLRGTNATCMSVHERGLARAVVRSPIRS